MLSDIEIAQSAKMLPITEIAEKLDILPEELEPYGRYKAKLSEDIFARLRNKPDGKLVLVTAINPTPAGEGKTTTSVGLGQAMAKIGENAVIALREPSLGPVFGIKGGAAGGGLFPSCTDGRYQPAFYRRYACHYCGEQFAVRHDRQPSAAGQSAWHRSKADSVQTLPGYE